MTRSIALSLISHTNVGKTTLARTLLGRDVGEIRDAAHVTIESERFVVCELPPADDRATPTLTLELWDTPGFGDSLRLAQRLEHAGNPLGWFMSEVWDRFRDRAFWSSQKAVRNILEHADLVLYLINASESPDDVSYIDAELKVLDLARKPVIVLLNQTGQPPSPQQMQADVDAWRERLAHAGSHAACVRDVLPLDAFTRCWVQEDLLYRAIERALTGQHRTDMRQLRQAIHARHQQVWHDATRCLAMQLSQTLLDRETVADPGLGETLKRLSRPLQQAGGQIAAKAKSGLSALRKPLASRDDIPDSDRAIDPSSGAGVPGSAATGEKAALQPGSSTKNQPEAPPKAPADADELAMQALAQRLQQRWADNTAQLLRLHQLDGQAAPDVLHKVASLFDAQLPVDERKAALLGGTLTGLLAGLKAELALGGLTLGGGLLLGGLLGALGAAGLAHGYNRVKGRNQASLQWSDTALTQQLESALLLYLTIAHYGRGRGAWEQPQTPAFWHQVVKQAILDASGRPSSAGPSAAASTLPEKPGPADPSDDSQYGPDSWAAVLASRDSSTSASSDDHLGQQLRLERRLHSLLQALSEQILRQLYPNTY